MPTRGSGRGRSGAGGGGRRGGGVSLGTLGGGRRITPVVGWIAGIEVGIYLLFLFGAPSALRTHLAMVPALFLGRHELWMPATALLVHVEALSLIINVLALWLFVPALEEIWGSWRFAAFFFGLGILGYALLGAFGWYLSPTLIAGGIGTPVLATVIAFGALYPKAPVSFFGLLPMTARQLAIGIAVFALGGEALQRAWAMVLSDGLIMVIAYLISSPGITSHLSLAGLRQRRLRRRYKVLPGGRWMN